MSWPIVFNGVRVARLLEICVLWINVFVLYRLGIVLSYWFIIVSRNCIFVTKYIDYWNSRCLIATRRDLTTLVLYDDECCICIPVRTPENSTKYLALLIARLQMLFTFLSFPFVASNTLASLSSLSPHAWMDTGVTLQKRHSFLWASTPDCLTTVSRISTEWKSSSLNRTVYGVIFNVRIGKDFGLKNSVVYTRTLLTENNKFVCIFSFTVFIVNEYFTTVTKLRICVHHLLLTIILSILKCVTLYQVIIIPSYLYSEMRELKIFNTSHFVTCTTIISNTHIRVNEIHLKTK